MKQLISRAWLALAVFAVLGISGHALAQHHGKNHAEHFAHVTTVLGLSDAQRAAARKVHDEAAAKGAPLEEQARLQHEEIMAMLESGSADPTALGRQMIAMHATHKQLKALHEQCMARISALLDAQQRAKFEQLHREHAGRGKHGPHLHGKH